MKKTDILIANRKCHIYEGEKAEFLLVQPIDEHDLEVLDKEVESIASLTRKAFTLVAFEVKNWQEDLTPWSAPAVFGKSPFGDGAAQTLGFITTELISSLKEMSLFDENSMKCLLGGYSLAGLFSLWAGYNTAMFYGIAAASPSVWYQGWIDYASANQPQALSFYLSLGDKEEKTKNAVMSQVGNCIRTQHDMFEKQGIRTILEWNNGNHFQDSHGRTAKAFAWLMTNN